MKLKADKHNANKGTKRGRALVEKSLKDLGAGRSILADKDGNIIAGNKTFEAAEKLGVPVRFVETDGTELVVVQRKDLDLEEPTGKARQLAYADNRAGELGLDWDQDVLGADVELGLDLGELGLDGAGAERKNEIQSGEINAEDFDNFDHHCPRCDFEWNDD